MQEAGRSHATVVPCSDPSGLVKGLKDTILERLKSEGSSEQYTLCLAGCAEAAINDKDVVQSVLRDGDCLLLKSEYMLHAACMSCSCLNVACLINQNPFLHLQSYRGRG